MYIFEDKELDLRNHAYSCGESIGNLIKFIYKNTHIKTGRRSSRENPNKFGFEPIIEVVAYILGENLGINIAKESIALAKICYLNEELNTIVNVSPDYTQQLQQVDLQDLYLTKHIQSFEFNHVAEKTNTLSNLLQAAIIYYIIVNEDRHERNISWLVKPNILILAPLYDHGYSLLYDDLRNFLGNQKTELCNCNSPLYSNSFYGLKDIIKKYKKESVNLLSKYQPETFKREINQLKNDYFSITDQTSNTVILDSKWFEKAVEFIEKRIYDLEQLLGEDDENI